MKESTVRIIFFVVAIFTMLLFAIHVWFIDSTVKVNRSGSGVFYENVIRGKKGISKHIICRDNLKNCVCYEMKTGFTNGRCELKFKKSMKCELNKKVSNEQYL